MKFPINGALALAALPLLVSCGAVVPDPVAEGAKDTYVIHMVVGSRGLPNVDWLTAASLALDLTAPELSLEWGRGTTYPAPGRLYGQVQNLWYPHNDTAHLLPREGGPLDECSEAVAQVRLPFLNAHVMPYDAVKLRSVRLDFRAQLIDQVDGTTDRLCYALHTPAGWKWNLRPNVPFVVDAIGDALLGGGQAHVVFPIDEPVVDQIVFAGYQSSGGISEFTYVASPVVP